MYPPLHSLMQNNGCASRREFILAWSVLINERAAAGDVHICDKVMTCTRLCGFQVANGRVYILLDYVNGGSLHSYLMDNKPNRSQKSNIMCQTGM